MLGSRYLHGVTVVNWPLQRLILSYRANRLHPPGHRPAGATTRPAASSASGAARSRRSASTSVRSDGYAFQIEMSFKCWRKGFRIVEIPIMFVDRRAGVSKMNRRIVWEAVWMVWRLRLLDLFGRVE